MPRIEGYENHQRLLKSMKNIILEGPPGTGKTFALEGIASWFEDLGGDGRGEFATTLHPITSYEDFVEGLRPNIDSNKNNNSRLLPVIYPLIIGNRTDIGVKVKCLGNGSTSYELLGKRLDQIHLLKYGEDGEISNADDKDTSRGKIIAIIPQQGTASEEDGNNMWNVPTLANILRPFWGDTAEKFHPFISDHMTAIAISDTGSTNEDKAAAIREAMSEESHTPVSESDFTPTTSGNGGWNFELPRDKAFKGENDIACWMVSIWITDDGKYHIEVAEKSEVKRFLRSKGAPLIVEVEPVLNDDGTQKMKTSRKGPQGEARATVPEMTIVNPIVGLPDAIQASTNTYYFEEYRSGSGKKPLVLDQTDKLIILTSEEFIVSDSFTEEEYNDLITAVEGKAEWSSRKISRKDLSYLEKFCNQSPETAAETEEDDDKCSNTSSFMIKDGFFLRCCKKAMLEPEKNFILLLDEINRCNIPKVLGDLMTTLESSKRLLWDSTEEAWDYRKGTSVTLPYSERIFSVPENIYVVGTMNTTDRSVAPLDSALRRRFGFLRVPPMDKTALKNALNKIMVEPFEGLEESVKTWDRLNTKLSTLLGKDAQIGHSYFFDAAKLIAATTEVDERQTIVGDLWANSLLPQLAELLDSTGDAEDLLDKIKEYFSEETEIYEISQYGAELKPESKLSYTAFQRTTVETTTPYWEKDARIAAEEAEEAAAAEAAAAAAAELVE